MVREYFRRQRKLDKQKKASAEGGTLEHALDTKSRAKELQSEFKVPSDKELSLLEHCADLK